MLKSPHLLMSVWIPWLMARCPGRDEKPPAPRALPDQVNCSTPRHQKHGSPPIPRLGRQKRPITGASPQFWLYRLTSYTNSNTWYPYGLWCPWATGNNLTEATYSIATGMRIMRSNDSKWWVNPNLWRRCIGGDSAQTPQSLGWFLCSLTVVFLFLKPLCQSNTPSRKKPLERSATKEDSHVFSK